MVSSKVSIITPAYNHEDFIGKCIKSVINQTYKNWEHIIIDDCSTDDTFKIASSLSKNNKGIKVIRHEKNWTIKRLADTYNQALELATGDYIAILEGDDFWPKDKLEKQIKSLYKNDYVFLYGDAIITNKIGNSISLYTYKFDAKKMNNSPIGSILNLFAGLDFSIIPCTVIIKRSALVKIGGFIKDTYYPFSDIPTFLNLALRGEFCYLKETLGYHRKHSSSSWFNFATGNEASGRKKIQKCINTFLSKKKLLRNELKRIYIYQEKYIQKKNKQKLLTNLFNQIAFENYNGTKEGIKNLFKLKGSYFFYDNFLVPIISFLLIKLPLLEINFVIRNVFYRLQKLNFPAITSFKSILG